MPGEDRGARLREALAAYDEALDLRRDVPLDYATTQNNRAILLRDLASLPGEDRGARLREALAASAEAVRGFEALQHVQYPWLSPDLGSPDSQLSRVPRSSAACGWRS